MVPRREEKHPPRRAPRLCVSQPSCQRRSCHSREFNILPDHHIPQCFERRLNLPGVRAHDTLSIAHLSNHPRRLPGVNARHGREYRRATKSIRTLRDIMQFHCVPPYFSNWLDSLSIIKPPSAVNTYNIKITLKVYHTRQLLCRSCHLLPWIYSHSNRHTCPRIDDHRLRHMELWTLRRVYQAAKCLITFNTG